jgi:hypothetical protein
VTPPQPQGALRLRLWSLDRRDAVARLSVTSLAAARVGEAALRSGVRLSPVPNLPVPVGVALVQLERPGLLRVEGTGGLRVAAESGVLCRPVTSRLAAAPGGRLYLVSDTPAEALRAERMVLGPGPGLLVDVPAVGRVPVDLAPASGPLLVRARSRSLQPGVFLGPAGGNGEGPRPMAVAEGLAQTVSLEPGRSMAVVSAATPPSSGLGPTGEATLEAVVLAPPRSSRLPAGITDLSVPSLASAAYELPSGAKRLRLTLSRDGVAVLAKGSLVEAVVASDSEITVATLDTEAPTLVLLQAGPGEGRFAIETLPAEGLELREGRPVELALGESGERRIAVGATGPASLRVRGAVVDATFVGRDGAVRRGRDLKVAGPGTLVVRHERGPLVAWLEREGETARQLWSVAGSKSLPVSPPAEVRLEGSAQVLAVESKEPALLQFRSATPLVTVLARAGGGEEADVHAEATALDAFLPAGQHELLLRPVLGGSLFGTAELQTTAFVPIAEGLGPEVVLPPGGSRGFSFTVESGGPVGVGVRASAEVAETLLLDANGRRLGAGVTQMPTLSPGRYFLVLRADRDGPAVLVRPALAGLTRPSTDPPAEVVQRYLEPSAGPPAFSARYVEDVPEAALGYEESSAEEGEYVEEPEEVYEEEEIEEPPPGAGEGGRS